MLVPELVAHDGRAWAALVKFLRFKPTAARGSGAERVKEVVRHGTGARPQRHIARHDGRRARGILRQGIERGGLVAEVFEVRVGERVELSRLVNLTQLLTIWSACGYGSGRRATPYTTLYMTVQAPTARPSVKTVRHAKEGARLSPRHA